jgi:hypothetical protein
MLGSPSFFPQSNNQPIALDKLSADCTGNKRTRVPKEILS